MYRDRYAERRFGYGSCFETFRRAVCDTDGNIRIHLYYHGIVDVGVLEQTVCGGTAGAIVR